MDFLHSNILQHQIVPNHLIVVVYNLLLFWAEARVNYLRNKLHLFHYAAE